MRMQTLGPSGFAFQSYPKQVIKDTWGDFCTIFHNSGKIRKTREVQIGHWLNDESIPQSAKQSYTFLYRIFKKDVSLNILSNEKIRF